MNNISKYKSLWEQVKANQDKLRSCPAHKFGKVLGARNNPPSGYPCENCKGYMSAHNIYIYTRGFKAAGGNPDNVALFFDGSSLNEQ